LEKVRMFLRSVLKRIAGGEWGGNMIYRVGLDDIK
jgi:hypothetical protein